jgi:predicted ATPase/DNA-binding SARP family transcriptional activator
MSVPVLPALPDTAGGEKASGLAIRLFGPMEVRLGSRPLPRLRSRKGLWLLALLALRAGRDVERRWLAETLWPGDDTTAARHSLRQSLHDLRLALGPEAHRLAGDAVRTVRLDVEGAFVDVLVFDAALARGAGAPEAWGTAERRGAGAERSEVVRPALETAVQLYRGPLLEDCAEDWVQPERRPREQGYVAALERLAAAATARGEHAAAVGTLQLAVSVDPCREELQRALMAALAAAGNPGSALLAYRQFRALLWRELAAEPAEETTALFRRLRDEVRARPPSRPPSLSPSLAPSPAPSPTPAVPRHLPLPLTELIGREAEVREVRDRLARSRLITLTGTGGIGKTRLALQVAEELAAEYADGARFVPLASLADPDRVPDTVRAALGLPPGNTREEPMDILREYLSSRRLLLVLDNCEHLLDACAKLADALLSQCPGVRLLATSRQALGLGGETVWRVPSLSLPDPKQGSMVDGQWLMAHGPSRPASTINHQPSTMMQFAAIRLFVERARAVEPSFALTLGNASAVVEICRRLDGIPLAIELAAARVRAIPVAQIAPRLNDRFRLLTGGSRGALPRQQTLRATMDWSYDLLSEPERTLLRRLSVFAGGLTLEAAEAVCGDEEGRRQKAEGSDKHRTAAATTAEPAGLPSAFCLLPSDVMDLLTQLVDRSLVTVERREEAARYVLLETTRDYARDRLREAGEWDGWRARHAEFFLAVAERAEPELRGPAQAEWLQRLEAEHDNLRAALDHFLDRGAVEEGLRLGGALGWFWWLRGYYSEGRERLQALLSQSGYKMGSAEPDGEIRAAQHARNAGRPELRQRRVGRALAKALNASGMLADEQSDYNAACVQFQESLTLSRELCDQAGVAAALKSLGGQAMRVRDLPAARALFEESLAISRRIGDDWSAAASLTLLGRVAFARKEYATARALVESGLEIQRQLRDRRAIARSLTSLGNIATRLGDYVAARSLYEESLALARELGTRGVIEETLNVLGTVARELGDHDAALACLEECLTIAREVGNVWGIAEGLGDLALLAHDRGEGTRAAALWSESLPISQRLGALESVAVCLEGFASLAVQPGLWEPGSRDRGSKRPVETVEGRDSARRAARLLGAAATVRELASALLGPRDQAEHERHVAAARALLDDAAFATAWAEGAAMSVQQACAYALT